MESKSSHIWLMVIISTFFWGSNFNAGHAVAGDVTPLTAAAERFAIALALFWVIRFCFGKAESQLASKDAFRLIPLGIIGVFGFNYAFFTAMHTTSALNAALIMALSPMVSTLLSVVLLNVKIRLYQYIGMLIAFVGVIFVITGGHFSLLHSSIGDVWMLLACFVWSLYSVGSKKYAGHIPSLQFARWTVSIGAVALIIAALLLEQPIETVGQLSLKTHSILMYMGVCGSVLAYIYWLKGVFFLGPEKSAVAFNLVPVFTLLVSLAFGTFPNLVQVLGMLLVLAGVLASTGWRPAFIKSDIK
ncbi:MAG: DMT family transporter [Gammaproteobacteria bacterium]|nr:MAG: DMT family transporter [Gammaproteobacteria bacterium]